MINGILKICTVSLRKGLWAELKHGSVAAPTVLLKEKKRKKECSSLVLHNHKCLSIGYNANPWICQAPVVRIFEK